MKVVPRMPTHNASSDIVGTRIWNSAYEALKAQNIDEFLKQLEVLRRHFILKTATNNYETISTRNLRQASKPKAPTSPNADTFVSHYKQLRTKLKADDLATKRAYVTHYDLAGYLGASLQTRLDPMTPGYEEEFRQLIRRELFSKILQEFLPSLYKNKDKLEASSVRASQLPPQRISNLGFTLIGFSLLVLTAGIVCATLSGIGFLPALPFLTEITLATITVSASLLSSLAISLTSIIIASLVSIVAFTTKKTAVPAGHAKQSSTPEEPYVTEDERILNIQADLIRAMLAEGEHASLDTADKEAIVVAVNNDFNLTLSIDDTEAFLNQLSLGIRTQAFMEAGVRIDERDCREIAKLCADRKAKVIEEGPIKQVDARNFYTKAPYLGISLTEEQILAVLNDNESIKLTENQVETLLINVSKKCDNFSRNDYVNLSSFIRNRKVRITPKLKAAMVKQYVNLEGRALHAYLQIKSADLSKRLEYRRYLDAFVSGIEIVTVEDLKNASLIALGNTLTRLQSARLPQWLSWMQPTILAQKITYIEDTITAIKDGHSGKDKEALQAKLQTVQASDLLATHRSCCSAFFRPTCSAREMAAIATWCVESQEHYKTEYENRFTL